MRTNFVLHWSKSRLTVISNYLGWIRDCILSLRAENTTGSVTTTHIEDSIITHLSTHNISNGKEVAAESTIVGGSHHVTVVHQSYWTWSSNPERQVTSHSDAFSVRLLSVLIVVYKPSHRSIELYLLSISFYFFFIFMEHIQLLLFFDLHEYKRFGVWKILNIYLTCRKFKPYIFVKDSLKFHDASHTIQTSAFVVIIISPNNAWFHTMNTKHT